MARSAGPADGSPAASPANGSPADGSPAAPPTTADFDYDLAPHAIAQTPAEPRDSARLLVDLDDESEPQHRLVSDLPELLGPGDLLVVNTTRVIPARLRLEKPTGGAAEVLLLEPLPAPHDAPPAPGWWSALVRPSRRLPDGVALTSPLDPTVGVTVGPRRDTSAAGSPERAPGGQRVVRVCAGDEVVVTPADAVRLLARAGEAPLPPYIDVDPARGRARDRAAGAERRAALAQRYQTVYADEPGSAAAPTAGLHFTPELIAALAERGVGWATVELVVGLDTFRPVVGELDDHVMHTEHYRVPAETRRRCREAERVVAVGTTTVRALESAARGEPAGRTSLFLRRGARFEAVDALITNFHLPRSTLLVMIDAFVGDRWRDLYALAQREGYRFLSFGDAMFLERRSL